jgi:excisionase family DNA binding protein
MAAVRPETTGRKTRDRGERKQAGRLVYTVPEAGRLLGLGRNAAYDAAKRGDIPTLRMGRLLLVPKIPFHHMLGITGTVIGTPTE